MNTFFQKIFKRKAKEVSDLYDFRRIEVAELDQYPDGIKNMQNREIDGFIIKGALSIDEVKTIDAAARTLPSSQLEVHQHSKGFVYPRPFSNLGVEVKESSLFFGGLDKARQGLPGVLGVDIEKRLFDLLGKMSGGRSVSARSPLKDEGRCMPFSVRYLWPETGVLEVHCGNLFHGSHSAFYDHIKDVNAYDQLSFIFMIQPSESSDLILFDKEWVQGQYKKDFGQKFNFTDENGEDVDCSENGIDRMTIRLEPGDFLTFTGGPIWHLVDEVKGEKGRITLGGFIGFSSNDEQVYCWS